MFVVGGVFGLCFSDLNHCQVVFWFVVDLDGIVWYVDHVMIVKKHSIKHSYGLNTC